jgi:hypothetical protein
MSVSLIASFAATDIRFVGFALDFQDATSWKIGTTSPCGMPMMTGPASVVGFEVGGSTISLGSAAGAPRARVAKNAMARWVNCMMDGVALLFPWHFA